MREPAVSGVNSVAQSFSLCPHTPPCPYYPPPERGGGAECGWIDTLAHTRGLALCLPDTPLPPNSVKTDHSSGHRDRPRPQMLTENRGKSKLHLPGLEM